MTSLPDLREALDCGYQAVVAIEVGEKDHARGWLAKGLPPSVRAFPAGSREAGGLAIVYVALLGEAA